MTIDKKSINKRSKKAKLANESQMDSQLSNQKARVPGRCRGFIKIHPAFYKPMTKKELQDARYLL